MTGRIICGVDENAAVREAIEVAASTDAGF
jgi:hypothetical protein